MTLTDQLSIAAGSVFTAVTASVVAWYASRIRTGRLLRTVDQVAKLCELTERLVKLQDSITNRSTDDTVRKLLESCLKAVSEDFERERQLLPEFNTSSTSFRKAMLLVIPTSRWVWPFQIAFYSMLIFGIVVLLNSLYIHQWKVEDSVAFGLAMGLALLARGLVALIARS